MGSGSALPVRPASPAFSPGTGPTSVLLALILALVLPLPASACRWEGLVADVPAGEVLFIFRGLEPRPHRIRLAWIACPPPDRPWGGRARALTAGLLGRRVTVRAGLNSGPGEALARVFYFGTQSQPVALSADGRQKSGFAGLRPLSSSARPRGRAYQVAIQTQLGITLQGRDLGLELLKLGLARCREGPGPPPAGYRRAQEEARRAGLGLWGSATEGLKDQGYQSAGSTMNSRWVMGLEMFPAGSTSR